MKTLLRTLLPLLFVALFMGSASAEEMTLKVFPLQHRIAAEMIPILRPMLDAGGAISGSGYKLIVRSTPKNLDEIQSMLDQLDTAPTSLLITVRQGVRDEGATQGGSVAGEIHSGDGRLSVSGGGRDHKPGASASVEGANGQARVKVYQTERKDGGEIVQRLRTTAGQWATIHTGQSIPYGQRTVTPYGTQDTIEYKNVLTGFQVQPRVSGDEVTLTVRPFRNRPAQTGGGAIDTEGLTTTIRGRLGEWIELGGVVEQSQQSGGAVTYSTDKKAERESRFFIKVDKLSTNGR